jgi:transcriptional regulator with XRE-family HTH domain
MLGRAAGREALPSLGRHRAQDTDGHVGARVRARRRLLGLTQQRLAERVGIAHQQVAKYETGVDRISAGRLFALARALGVEPGYFFEGLGGAEPARPTAQQRLLLELARSLVALPRRQQEVLCELARALADAEAPAEVGPGEAARDAI